jgi:hypothetical protein
VASNQQDNIIVSKEGYLYPAELHSPELMTQQWYLSRYESMRIANGWQIACIAGMSGTLIYFLMERHSKAVLKALEEGRPVAAETIIVDYPELKRFFKFTVNGDLAWGTRKQVA